MIQLLLPGAVKPQTNDEYCKNRARSVVLSGTANQFMQVQIQPRLNQQTLQVHPAKQQPNLLPINDAIQVKAAEYWLELGEADLALRELENLSSRIWKRGWVLKTRIAAIGALREPSEVTVRS